MSGSTLLGSIGAAALVLLTSLVGLGVFLGGASGACTLPANTLLPPPGGGALSVVRGFDTEQIANAEAIVQTATALAVPLRGSVIAVAVALQESGLRNLDHGDTAGPDSRGLFQQRTAWGTTAARRDPAQAARMFFLGGAGGQPGLLDITGWQAMPLTRAAQAVQRSRYPTAYAAHEDDATRLVTALAFPSTRAVPGTGGPPSSSVDCRDDQVVAAQAGGPTASAAAAISYARAQLGLPYEWGGNGPQLRELPSGRTVRTGGFDCSGLVKAAYAAAGVDLPRTAQTQYNAGPLLPPGTPLEAGDLLFFGTPTAVHHVGLYTGSDHQMIDAPHHGAFVRVEDYTTWPDFIAASRPAS